MDHIKNEVKTMIRSRRIQLAFQTLYCLTGLVGVYSSLGLVNGVFLRDFYVYFTNLSNYLCLGVMGVQWVQTLRRRGDGFVNTAPRLKFTALIGILLTALVFNLLLASHPDRDPALNMHISSILLHVVLPALFVLDWLLFYEHGRLDLSTPLRALLLPLGYLVFILIHAALWNFDASIPNALGGSLIYPYFFLNVDKLGIGGVLQWCGILLAALAVMGYLIIALDRLLGRKKG